MELTKQVLETVRSTIEEQWSVDRGCSFTVADGRGVKWDVDVPSCNKWDCWAIKQGTRGRQFRTFEHFNGRGE